MTAISLRDVMRGFPQGVVVVTAEGDEGPRGVTVSSFTSVSLTPPRILVCIMKESRAHSAIAKGPFVVNVLSETQCTVSDHFASPKLSSEEQFAEYTSAKLDGCLGYLHCRVVGETEQGDHTVFFGEVERAEMGDEGKPLVFWAREYWALGEAVHKR
ncbi:MAG: flavin reductase [Acidobacteria bacterium]|nr:MAG: flavin reductase [Acidobacteriota bacterium]